MLKIKQYIKAHKAELIAVLLGGGATFAVASVYYGKALQGAMVDVAGFATDEETGKVSFVLGLNNGKVEEFFPEEGELKIVAPKAKKEIA